MKKFLATIFVFFAFLSFSSVNNASALPPSDEDQEETYEDGGVWSIPCGYLYGTYEEYIEFLDICNDHLNG